MSYTIAIAPAAEAQLDAMPAELSLHVREQLIRLATNPTALSKPGSALQPHGQLFEFKYERDGTVVWVSITFRFGQDEQTIHVEYFTAEFG